MAEGNQSGVDKGKAPAVEPDCPFTGGGGGGSGSTEPLRDLGHGRYNGSNGGGVWPSDLRHYWNGNGSNGESSARGSRRSMGLANPQDGCTSNDGAGRYWMISGGGGVGRYAAGSGGGSGTYGGDGGQLGNGGGRGGTGAADLNWRDPGYIITAGVDWSVPGNGSGSASLTSVRIGAGTHAPAPQYASPGIWPNGGADMYVINRAPMDNWHLNDAVPAPPFVPNGGRPRSPPRRWYDDMEHMDELVAEHLRARLTIGDGQSGSPTPGRGHRRVSEFLQTQQAQAQPLRNAGGGGGGPNGRLPPARGRAAATDPYRRMRMEDVRGRMRHIAMEPAGCEFLVRMVREGGAPAAQQVFNEIAGEIVRLMVHDVGRVLVQELAKFWTEEHIIERVLWVLSTAPSDQIVAAATNQAGSNVLQSMIPRIVGQAGLVESFTRTLAGDGASGLISLIEDMSGSQLILKCLETFTADQNRFITNALLRFPLRACLDRHGCNVMNRSIDTASNEQVRDSLIHAVCRDAVALAEHGYGNYVVQHIIEFVPEALWARDMLHEAFRGQYVSLSRQKASSHVVQRCLQFFSREQTDEIIVELLHCQQYCEFHELISDPYANYVLQTAMECTPGQIHMTLLGAISVYRNTLREDRFARMVLQKLLNLRRPYR
ncbi:hypothetical protein ACP4OV_006374 [Aristida adscensionis]